MTPASPTEIADLLAWARRLAEAGPTDRVAYLAAKADLLTRIPAPPEHTDEDSR